MPHTQTIAIIGASEPAGVYLSKALAPHYRLLLMDKKTDPLNDLQNEIIADFNNAEVEVISCCRNASWEADIIVITATQNEHYNVANEMREVATCKPVIAVSELELSSHLPQLLPYAKIVNAHLVSNPISAGFQQAEVQLWSADDEALETATVVLQKAGLTVTVSQPSLN